MKCQWLHHDQRVRTLWHRLWCPECRAARSVDALLARGVAQMRAERAPSGGLPELLAAVGIRSTEEFPFRPRPVRSRRLALVTAAFLAVLGLALAHQHFRRPTGSDPSQIARGLKGGRILAPGSGTLRRQDSERPAPQDGRPTRYLRGSSDARRLGATLPPAVSERPYSSSPKPPVDDLVAVNGEPSEATLRLRAGLSRDERDRIEERLRRTIQVRDDFVPVPFPRLADASNDQVASAAASYQREAAIIDARLSREVTLAIKATALSDLCDQLRNGTGIRLEAGPSVADEKVTVFCEKMPLRDLMRQLGRPFGYTWLRSGREEEYRYELTQDLRSQLLEEELRNRDRNAALIALDSEMQRYRPYLQLSPDEALARAKSAPPEEKKLLERLGGGGWGPAQIYFRLSGKDLAALRAGQSVRFSAEPKPREAGRGLVLPAGPEPQQLPPDLERGILQSQRGRRIRLQDGRYRLGPSDGPEGLPPASVPGTRAMLMLRIVPSELGQFTYQGDPGIFIGAESATPGTFQVFGGGGVLSVGTSPAVRDPRNGIVNARWARDPALKPRVTVRPQGSCREALEPLDIRLGTARPQPEAAQAPELRVTTADVLEALHRATRLPLVADYYTRLYAPTEVTVHGVSLFEALNRLADTMRLRWSKDGTWLQFRSTGYFHDRLKEVPNRLLVRWAASRREHGALRLEDLLEIAQLSDAQLDASSMAEGARACFGLAEWDLPRVKHLRAQLRYLMEFTPEQRQQAQTSAGLSFARMNLAQQQSYLAQALRRSGDLHLDNLAQATLHVEYTLPGWFRWSAPGRAYQPSPVRERTREAALQAALRIDPQASEAQIQPTRLDVTFLYSPNTGAVRLVRTTDDGWLSLSELSR